ncbi:MAG TPA: hypothetical protein VNS29_13500 [Burkholderiaceae bacterium]|nr:hypothetical protein [Burkholderiaceae bacterium]
MSKKGQSTVNTIARTIIDQGRPGPTGSPMTVIDSLNSLHQVYADYQKLREQERTKRAAIQAQSSVALEQIRSQRQIIERALTDTFELRKLGLQAQISAMDKALDKGDTEGLHIVLEQISTTIQSSPLKDLAQMRKQLADDTFTLKLE